MITIDPVVILMMEQVLHTLPSPVTLYYSNFWVLV
jgi:hypothetical protein